MTDTAPSAALYAEHLAIQLARIDAALAAEGLDTLVIASGVERMQFLDDMPYPFRPNPHFKLLLPLSAHPGCWIVHRPGRKPTLIYLQPRDYWHQVPKAPSGDWTAHFEVEVIRTAEAAAALLPQPGPGVAILAEGEPLPGWAGDASESLLARLHYPRAIKTAYELACMRVASLAAVRGHRAAADAFHAGGSEFDIHLAYLKASGHAEVELPYGNIIGLNEHGAVLHYQVQDKTAPLQSLSLLIDAGAQYRGYAADITRTHARHAGYYADLIRALDAAQLRLCEQVRPGVDYRDIHLAAHLEVACILAQAGLVKMSPEAIVESGVSSHFFPHGIGHLIGLQVHDVAGRAAGPTGGERPRPDGHPYLRLTRPIEADMVVTIEPGIYFIDLLLGELADSRHAGAIAWNEVDALRHYGGIRIEDDVRATATGTPENLSRAAFAEIAAA